MARSVGAGGTLGVAAVAGLGNAGTQGGSGTDAQPPSKMEAASTLSKPKGRRTAKLCERAQEKEREGRLAEAEGNMTVILVVGTWAIGAGLGRAGYCTAAC